MNCPIFIRDDNIKLNFLLPENTLPANVLVDLTSNECGVSESESLSYNQFQMSLHISHNVAHFPLCVCF